MQRPEHRQRQGAAQVRTWETAPGLFGAGNITANPIPNNSENIVQNLPRTNTWTNQPAQWSIPAITPGGRPPGPPIGRLKNSTFIRKMPSRAKPRTTSSAWMRWLPDRVEGRGQPVPEVAVHWSSTGTGVYRRTGGAREIRRRLPANPKACNAGLRASVPMAGSKQWSMIGPVRHWAQTPG